MREYFHIIQRFFAKIWLQINLQLTVVGVTGSYGKTSAVMAITSVLRSKYSVNRTDIDLDTIYNLPITILRTKIWNEILVLEYGVDHIGEMNKHLSLVKPNIAVLTGVTSVHSDQEHFGSVENIIKEKKKLIEALPENGLAIFNYDDEIVRKIGEEFEARKIFYGLDKRADVWADKIKITIDGTEFVINDNKETIEIRTGILGYPAVYSCLVAYAVGIEKKIDKNKIISQLAELKPLSGRFSIEPGPLDTLLVNDSKRANFASTIAGLKSLSRFQGRKVAVLGEMGEIGEDEELLHCKIGKEAAKLKLDMLIGVGKLTKYSVEEAKKAGMKTVFWVKDVNEAADLLKNSLKKDDILYLKASLHRHLERIVMLLNEKKVDCTKVVCNNYSPCDTCAQLIQ